MTKSTKAAPPNSLVFVLDSETAELPLTLDGALIAATDSCVAIGCQSSTDGGTEFTLGRANEVDPGSSPVFRGSLATPNRRLAIQSILGDTILETIVQQPHTHICIWVNDAKEPDEIVIGID